MAQEIERKFLVKGTKWRDLICLKKTDIVQGYLHKSKEMNIRIRISGDRAYITIKGKRIGLTSPEFEYEIPFADAHDLIKLSITPLVHKTRHVMEDDFGQVWDIDVFQGINKGLTMAEIEMESEQQDVKLPSWVGREVSHDRRYANAYLAQHEVPRK